GDRLKKHGPEYPIRQDVGASPTTSVLEEMPQFLKIHAGRSEHATPAEALFRATRAPAKMLGLQDRLGALEVGQPMSFIEVACDGTYQSADDAIRRGLLGLPEHPDARLEAALDELEQVRLDIGPGLELLEGDVRETADRLEKKVISVTLAGRQIWRRDGEKVV